MSRYTQGWQQVRDAMKRKEWWREYRRQSKTRSLKRLIVKALGLTLLAFITGAMLFGLMGCATSVIVEKGPLVEIADKATLRGLVQVAQMGNDCTEQETLMKRAISDMFVGADVPAPDKIEIRALAGSSLCGLEQGMADPVGIPDPGARNVAKAEVALYWSLLYESQLRRANRVLTLMAPLQPYRNKK